MLAAAGRKSEARQLIADALHMDGKSIHAWSSLAKFAGTTSGEILCLKRIVHLDPRHTWANQRLQELAASQRAKPFTKPAGALKAPTTGTGIQAQQATHRSCLHLLLGRAADLRRHLRPHNRGCSSSEATDASSDL